ncbi:MAG: hypothetical protein ACI85F_000992 [Bacteroidia bacterium]|jgi:hypothetical protein
MSQVRFEDSIEPRLEVLYKHGETPSSRVSVQLRSREISQLTPTFIFNDSP